MNTIRAFIAIELTPAVLTQLAHIQEQFKASLPRGCVRWVRTEGIHLTLKFLGDVPQSQVDTIQLTLASAVKDIPAFSFRVGQAGCFPNARRPRVLWIGIQEPGGVLSRLERAVETAIAPLGYPAEERDFHPHLTLGRVARNVNASDLRQVGDALASANIGDLGQVEARQVALVKSELKPTGAEYTILFCAPLA